jgi:hypothetical protein
MHRVVGPFPNGVRTRFAMNEPGLGLSNTD